MAKHPKVGESAELQQAIEAWAAKHVARMHDASSVRDWPDTVIGLALDDLTFCKALHKALAAALSKAASKPAKRE